MEETKLMKVKHQTEEAAKLTSLHAGWFSSLPLVLLSLLCIIRPLLSYSSLMIEAGFGDAPVVLVWYWVPCSWSVFSEESAFLPHLPLGELLLVPGVTFRDWASIIAIAPSSGWSLQVRFLGCAYSIARRQSFSWYLRESQQTFLNKSDFPMRF